MKFFLKQSVLVLVLMCVAVAVSFASYTPPTVGPTANNNEVEPLTEGLSPQVKTGSLSVNAFQARGNTWFKADTTFGGTLFGGTPILTAPLYFGDAFHKVTTDINGGAFIGGAITSPTVQANISNNGKLCADPNGVFVPCITVAPVNTQFKVVLSTNIARFSTDEFGGTMTSSVFLTRLQGLAGSLSQLGLFNVDTDVFTYVEPDAASFKSNGDGVISEYVVLLPAGVYQVSTLELTQCAQPLYVSASIGYQFILDDAHPEQWLDINCPLWDSGHIK